MNSYWDFRKPSKPKIVDRSKFSIVPDREGIIKYISSLQQL